MTYFISARVFRIFLLKEAAIPRVVMTNMTMLTSSLPVIKMETPALIHDGQKGEERKQSALTPVSPAAAAWARLARLLLPFKRKRGGIYPGHLPRR